MEKIRENLPRVLVVDESRVVRATLAKHLKDVFEVREENNGESAWQTLVLDAGIVAVICGARLPKLDSHELIERLRASALRRLKAMPFVLIVSEVEDHAAREKDRAHGFADFITKAMRKAEIVSRLRALLDAGAAECRGLPEIRGAALPAILTPPKRSPKLLSSDEIRFRISHALADASAKGSEVCAVMFGIVNHDQLIERFGDETAREIGERFAELLLATIGPHDGIASHPQERLVIISSGVSLVQCVHFAKRVCRSLAASRITIRGEPLKLTASAGAASSAEPGVASGKSLLALASRRLDQAMACGGNTVIIEDKPDCPLHQAELLLPGMLASLGGRDECAIAARVGSFGLQILPLLKVINDELSLGLHLPEIRRQLQERARSEATRP